MKSVCSCGLVVGVPISCWSRGLGLFMLEASMSHAVSTMAAMAATVARDMRITNTQYFPSAYLQTIIISSNSNGHNDV